MCNAIDHSNSVLFREVPFQLSKTKQIILIALSTIMALGMILSYVFGAPWIITVGFFALTMAPLFPLWKIRNPRSNRIEE